MATEISHTPHTHTIDLTGLPEPVVQGIRQIVETFRETLTSREKPVPVAERLPLRGRFAEANVSIPKEVIDEARREAWANFPRDFPDANE
jgi:hypothetical protein